MTKLFCSLLAASCSGNPIVRQAAAAKSIELLSIIHLSLETLHYRRDPIDPYIRPLAFNQSLLTMSYKWNPTAH